VKFVFFAGLFVVNEGIQYAMTANRLAVF